MSNDVIDTERCQDEFDLISTLEGLLVSPYRQTYKLIIMR